MKRLVAGIALFLFFAQAQIASACAIATFEPPLTTVNSGGRSDVILFWDGAFERLILQPNLRGNAQDFGMAFAFPSRPEVTEASRELFSQLDEYTAPQFAGKVGGDAPQAALPAVQLLEKRTVGDFTVSILTADDAGALIEWLLQNQYNFSEEDKANFAHYVSKGGYYFAALKVNTESTQEIPSYMRRAISDEYGFTPIEFRFATQAPFFPLRLARDSDPVQNLRLYTVSAMPLVVWGTDIPFTNKMGASLPSGLSSFVEYPLIGQWLTRLDLRIDPSKIEEDLLLSEWANPYAIHIFEDQSPVVLQAQLVPARSGIVLSQANSQAVQQTDNPPYTLPYDYYNFWDVFFPLFLALLFALGYIYAAAALYSLAGRLLRFISLEIFAWGKDMNTDETHAEASLPEHIPSAVRAQLPPNPVSVISDGPTKKKSKRVVKKGKPKNRKVKENEKKYAYGAKKG